jgi:hypothetical protein
MTVSCNRLLIAVLLTHLMMWLADPNWIVLMFLVIFLGIVGEAVVQSQTVKMVRWMSVLVTEWVAFLAPVRIMIQWVQERVLDQRQGHSQILG